MKKPNSKQRSNDNHRIRQWYMFDTVYRVGYAIVCCRPAQFKERLVRLLPQEILAGFTEDDFSVTGVNGRCIRCWHNTYGDIVVLYFRPERDRCGLLPTVAHEAFHATFQLLTKKGMAPSGDSEEAYAYYLEWLTREILKRIK